MSTKGNLQKRGKKSNQAAKSLVKTEKRLARVLKVTKRRRGNAAQVRAMRTPRAIATRRKYFATKTKNSVALNIAAGIANPIGCPNLRLKSNACSADMTAVVQLHAYDNYKQNTISTTRVYDAAGIITLGNSFVALFRDAFRAYVVFTTNPSNSSYSYTANVLTTDATAVTTFWPIAANGDSYLSPLYFGATSTYQPHDQYLFTGVAYNYHWCWMDLATVMTFTQSATLASTLYVYLWDGKETTTVYTGGEVAFATGSATFTCAKMGYYCFQVINSTGTAHTITVTYTGASETFAHHAVNTIKDHLTVLGQHRVNAASMLISPICPEIAKNGSINAAWYPPQNIWTDQVGFAVNSKASTCRVFPFSKGIYAYVKPSSEADLLYSQTVIQTNHIVTDCGFDLNASSKYTAINIAVDTTVSADTPISATGLEFLLTHVANIEIITDDQWHELESAPGAFKDFMAALEVVSSIEPYHENPLHWSDIWGVLKRGFNFVRTGATPIAAALSSLFPSAAGGIMAGANVLRALPEA
jgi:hypothetical protein